MIVDDVYIPDCFRAIVPRVVRHPQNGQPTVAIIRYNGTSEYEAILVPNWEGAIDKYMDRPCQTIIAFQDHLHQIQALKGESKQGIWHVVLSGE